MLLDFILSDTLCYPQGSLVSWLCLERRFWVLCPKMTCPTCRPSSLVPGSQELELFSPLPGTETVSPWCLSVSTWGRKDKQQDVFVKGRWCLSHLTGKLRLKGRLSNGTSPGSEG